MKELKVYMKEFKIYLLNLFMSLQYADTDESVEIFKILCRYPQYFNIKAPIQEGVNYIYTVEAKPELYEFMV